YLADGAGGGGLVRGPADLPGHRAFADASGHRSMAGDGPVDTGSQCRIGGAIHANARGRGDHLNLVVHRVPALPCPGASFFGMARAGRGRAAKRGLPRDCSRSQGGVYLALPVEMDLQRFRLIPRPGTYMRMARMKFVSAGLAAAFLLVIAGGARAAIKTEAVT